jgi:hypothetical protein
MKFSVLEMTRLLEKVAVPFWELGTEESNKA